MSFSVGDINGVIPALVTCFDEEEAFDPIRMRNVVRFLLTQGVSGFYVAGSTGEAFTMTPQERKQLTETVIDEVAGKVPVIVHVGAIGTRISEDLARHAKSAGADAVSSVPPFYWNFSADAVVKYYRDLAAAAELPMIVYNIALAGNMSFPTILRLSKIEGVAGIKFTSPAQHEVLHIRQEAGDHFKIFTGMDEMAFSGLSYGADGIIGSFYNLIPDVYLRMAAAYAAGDMQTALGCQKLADRIIYLSLEYDYIPLIKSMLGWMGVDAGYSRRPFSRYTEPDLKIIRSRFSKLKEEHADTLFLNTL